MVTSGTGHTGARLLARAHLAPGTPPCPVTTKKLANSFLVSRGSRKIFRPRGPVPAGLSVGRPPRRYAQNFPKARPGLLAHWAISPLLTLTIERGPSMSIADLKMRLADVPGIESLSRGRRLRPHVYSLRPTGRAPAPETDIGTGGAVAPGKVLSREGGTRMPALARHATFSIFPHSLFSYTLCQTSRTNR
jgi:hypothetical protein